MSLAFAYINKAGFRPDITHPVGAGFRPDIAHPVGAGFRPDITHPVGAGFRPDIAHPVGAGFRPDITHPVGAGFRPDITHPVGAGFRPDIAHPVGAGLKPAPTTTPRTTEDRIHLCEYATILTTRDAGDGDSISCQVKRFQAQDVLLGKLRPYPAKITCPKRNGVCLGETGRTHPVGAGLKPAPTTAPRTAEERLHLCEYATILTPRGAGNRH